MLEQQAQRKAALLGVVGADRTGDFALADESGNFAAVLHAQQQRTLGRFGVADGAADLGTQPQVIKSASSSGQRVSSARVFM